MTEQELRAFETENKYKVAAVPNTYNNRINLEEVIRNRALNDFIVYHLRSLGVDVKFLEKEGEISRYTSNSSVKNGSNPALQLKEGYYTLIEIAINGKLSSDNES